MTGDFVLLAGVTAPDVLFCLLVHLGPVKQSPKVLDGYILPDVVAYFGIVKEAEELSLE